MSSKTPTKQDEETESAPKKPTVKFLSGTIAILSLLVVVIVLGISNRTEDRKLIAPKGTINLEWLDTTESRTLGLSGRDGIADDSGLLFVFDQSATQNCFWMKDMKFSIDMVWFNDAKQVVTVSKDVSPDTYPDSFCPESQARYGLEVGAGRAEELGLAPGVRVSF